MLPNVLLKFHHLLETNVYSRAQDIIFKNETEQQKKNELFNEISEH